MTRSKNTRSEVQQGVRSFREKSKTICGRIQKASFDPSTCKVALVGEYTGGSHSFKFTFEPFQGCLEKLGVDIPGAEIFTFDNIKTVRQQYPVSRSDSSTPPSSSSSFFSGESGQTTDVSPPGTHTDVPNKRNKRKFSGVAEEGVGAADPGLANDRREMLKHLRRIFDTI